MAHALPPQTPPRAAVGPKRSDAATGAAADSFFAGQLAGAELDESDANIWQRLTALGESS